ncbi:NAD-dependent epimerase/dehydratase family protein [Paenibacillus hamazuiensis]|uniref:NAD-dependent epimerase/dehydratase family protein n=1 Tax=Paenibacillus hamazuiensis TaxID=2936508 RepID=UPI00200E1240|nr:NAD(P)-dependent oxidoreductase [Paenibacillus hamazuiensis]
MKIFVAGATGVVGRLLLPLLVQAGHEVVGMTGNASRKSIIQALGAKPVVADAFDKDAVAAALLEARPDAVIHQLTSLSAWDLAENAKIRTEGTRNLVDASLRAGVRRMIAQSISWAYEPGDSPAAEEVPLDTDAPMPRKTTIDGVVSLEKAAAEMPEHVILRYGLFYGPGTWYHAEGLIAEKARRKELPAGEGIASFLHVEDAARAALLALEWPTGIVNVTDDEPAAGTDWLPAFAAAVGAPAPEQRAAAGRGERGASNAKARKSCGWEPLHPTWREGFKTSLTR